MINKKRSRESGEIEGSSLADIAFLLLIFFLVVTTIDVDAGIGLVLPPIPDDIDPPPILERNMLRILVNAQGMIQLDDESVSINEVQDRIIEFVDNNGVDPELSETPDDAIVSIKTQSQTPYNVYIDMLDEVMGAYRTLRNQASQDRFGVPYASLEENSPEQEQIQELYPKRISIAEPDEG